MRLVLFPESEQVSRQLSSAWAAFARTGKSESCCATARRAAFSEQKLRFRSRWARGARTGNQVSAFEVLRRDKTLHWAAVTGNI